MSRDRVLIATLLTALTPMLWGSTYIVSTELLPDGRPLLAAAVRALPVGLAFLLWKRRLPEGAWWWRAAVLGMLNIGAFFALLFVGAFRLPGGVAATAGAMQPLIAATIAVPLLGDAFTRRIGIAGGAGALGVALLVLAPDAALDPVGLAAALGGAVSMATGVVLAKRWRPPVDIVTFTGWQLTAGGLFLAPLAFAVEGVPDEITAANASGFAWLAIVGTGFAYVNWFRGIGRLPVSTVSLLTLLTAPVAAVLGWAFVDQSLTPLQLAGGALVLAAVALGGRATRQPDGPNRTAPPVDPDLPAVVTTAA